MNQYAFYNFEGHFPRAKRNFIKENVKSIKQMQGILQEAGAIHSRKDPLFEKYKSETKPVAPKIIKSKESDISKSVKQLGKSDSSSQGPDKFATKARNTFTIKNPIMKTKIKALTKKDTQNTSAHSSDDSRITHRAMQTEREEDISKLYDTGVIKYPSPGLLKSHRGGQGDPVNDIIKDLDTISMEDKDFIRENKNIKPKTVKQSPVKVLAQAPANYQRGVVPKYLRDRKDDASLGEQDAECPPGHVLLPEEERKETLRVLRQSYADRIQELNMMPVRNDTLKMRKRKMEIEEELKRIDGGIKVFQRPKVYVKINA
ncbi:uncharacterized protein LOC126739839 isoform X2 [Anthonomus grandis grandis]|uniref:uncharacterized protein LOC126739839 isoform X2 n=1 Tax=Anthonomus grandis grandis TaxID=2921223 RepID=UPI00216691CD|nr:uncharacterized protein LOC126739839 isoform X2 [Anthonomus grandis grandis]